VDRYLVTGAISLLIIELFVLFDNNSWIHFSNKNNDSQNSIGKMLDVREKVRKKSQHSIAWEDSLPNDILKPYDSILTLESSSARLSLSKDIQLTLHENTLIVIEPEEDLSQSSLSFEKGFLISKVKQKNLRLGTTEWTILAQPGTDLSLKSLNDKKLEIEVLSGNILLKNKTSKTEKSFNKNSVIITNQKEVEFTQTISKELKWENNFDRIYTFNSDVFYKLEWIGNAYQLQLIHPDKRISHYAVDNSRSLEVTLPIGTHIFRLVKNNETSLEKIIEVYPAPKIHYYSPLPRERVDLNKDVSFVWNSIPFAKEYEVEFIDKSSNKILVKNIFTESSFKLKFEMEKDILWHIKAIDKEGFRIPSSYEYQLYSTKNPFTFPQIKSMKLRSPAQEKKPPTLINKFFNALIPKAYAQNMLDGEIRLDWESIPGADYYEIEISSQPHFMNPEVQSRTYTPEFIWKSQFQKNQYYFRVAAGNKDGRMGLFSPVQVIDISKLEVETPTIELTQKKMEAHFLETLSLDKFSDIFDSSLNSTPLNIIEKSLNLEALEPKYDFKLDFSFNYIKKSLEIKNDFKSDFSEWTKNNLNFLIKTKSFINIFYLSYQEFAPNELELPFQNTIYFWEGNYQFLYNFNKTHSLGISIFKENSFTRSNYETIKPKDHISSGISYLFLKDWGRLNYNLNFQTLKGSDFLSINFKNRLYSNIYTPTFPLDFIFGIQLEYQVLFGSTYKGEMFSTGVFTGLDW
jgi:hypothetical protein